MILIFNHPTSPLIFRGIALICTTVILHIAMPHSNACNNKLTNCCHIRVVSIDWSFNFDFNKPQKLPHLGLCLPGRDIYWKGFAVPGIATVWPGSAKCENRKIFSSMKSQLMANKRVSTKFMEKLRF